MIYDMPIFFEKNRVFRVYQGGLLLGKYVGDGSLDSNYPEEWIASCVKAQNRQGGPEKEGVSKIEGEDIYLDELLQKYPREILGEKEEIGVLVKFIDSAIRLPVQVHPDKRFARKYFNSEHGKEESWVVLAKRPGGCIFFGFNDGVTRQQFEEAVEKSKNDKKIMEKLLVRHDVEPGDVIFVPARTVHAIGAGCLMLEVQEPTDFTIQPEYRCGDYELTEQEMYIGLDKNDALDCFDFEPIKKIKLKPEKTESGDGVQIDCLICSKQTDKFGLNRIILNGGNYVPKKDAGIYVVTAGRGKIAGDGYSRDLKQGEYFIMPHKAVGRYVLSGTMTVMECYA